MSSGTAPFHIGRSTLTDWERKRTGENTRHVMHKMVISKKKIPTKVAKSPLKGNR